jgi:hypothetical protein
MRLSTRGKSKQVEIHIQVYNSNTDSFVLEKKISQSGKELICSGDTWGCILTNTIMDEIVDALKK